MPAFANPGDLDPTFGRGGWVITSFPGGSWSNAVKVEGAGHHNLSGAAFGEYRSAIAELFGVKPSRL